MERALMQLAAKMCDESAVHLVGGISDPGSASSVFFDVPFCNCPSVGRFGLICPFLDCVLDCP